MEKAIELKGVRVNNLQNIDLTIPRNKLIVVAGLSGSGKSSLAFDTLYAEGQRRYVESLSSYARQFLGRMHKPECDSINGLPPAIAIQQKVVASNPRSTVGTSTEIYDYMRLLFARIGHTYSPISGQEVKKHSVEDIVEATHQYSEGTPFLVLAPIVLHEESLTQKLLILQKQGFARIYHNGEVFSIADVLEDDQLIDTITNGYLVIDRLRVDFSDEAVSRLTDSVETALFEGHSSCSLCFLPANIKYDFSALFEADGITFEEPSEHLFSYNSPVGACPTCEGFGNIIGIDERLVIPNSTLSVYDGCVQCWHGDKMGMWKDEFCRRAATDDFPIFTPYNQLTTEQRGWLWHGLPSDQKRPQEEQVSIDAFFQMVQDNQYKIQYRVMLSRYRGRTVCPSCHGGRLKKEANYVLVGGKSITELVSMSVEELSVWFEQLQLTEQEQVIGKRLLVEIKSRLSYLNQVGLGYLTLNRASNTLSGGESQRVNLTTAIGSSLVGSLYILDEPSIGLHSKDTKRLLSVLRSLQQVGNTVVVVEHDKEIIEAADYLIDIGPKAGQHGGKVVYAGPIDKINATLLKKYPDSLTLKYLAGKDEIEQPLSRRTWNREILLRGARMNNLKGIDLHLPLNVLTVVTGPSGSGKSSLITNTLYVALKRHLGIPAQQPGEYLSLEGDISAIGHVEMVDQSPIGKSSRSNPATYTKAFDEIRRLFAQQQLSEQMGYTPQHFSFNADGGRCDECQGAGIITIPMQFMADVQLTCPVCHGTRFKREILDVKYFGKSVHDVLHMTVEEAIAFFSEHGEQLIVQRLQPLMDVGLSYLHLGQSASSLSGGENQRLKLASFIASGRRDTPTLFIFDEPTTGLHHHDLLPLLHAFDALLRQGHTVVVIEHNPDMIRMADYLVELGPEGGHHGGYMIYQGAFNGIRNVKESLTKNLL